MMPTVAFSQPYTNPDLVDLGTAGNYRVLSGTTLTIAGTCTVTGNVGGTAVTNNGSVSGTTDVGNPAYDAAISALNSAINTLAARTNIIGTTGNTLVGVGLDGLNLGRGIYDGPGTFTLNATLTLTGNATDIFIFRTGSPGTTIITGSGCIVNLVGVLASNVYWIVGSAAEIDGDFKGNILARTYITQTSVTTTLNGRALGQTAVTLDGASVLPVELLAFTATANRTKAYLHWSTATEVNNYGFDIERRLINSKSSTANNWTKIGFVEGNGTSNSAHSYSYTDASVSSGTYAYRLKQIDNNGTYKYSSETEITIAVPKVVALNQNYPNPFNPTTTITFTLAQDGFTTLKIYDMLGREVTTLVNGEMKSGVMNAVSFNASKLSSGVYFSRLESSGNVQTKTLMLLK